VPFGVPFGTLRGSIGQKMNENCGEKKVSQGMESFSGKKNGECQLFQFKRENKLQEKNARLENTNTGATKESTDKAGPKKMKTERGWVQFWGGGFRTKSPQILGVGGITSRRGIAERTRRQIPGIQIKRRRNTGRA